MIFPSVKTMKIINTYYDIISVFSGEPFNLDLWLLQMNKRTPKGVRFLYCVLFFSRGNRWGFVTASAMNLRTFRQFL